MTTLEELHRIAVERLDADLAKGYSLTIHQAVTASSGRVQVDLDIRLHADKTWEIIDYEEGE